MAFQQQRPPVQRQTSPAKAAAPSAAELQTPASPSRKRLEESQEWILFSPQNEQSTTSQTPRTATQLSSFGSLETHVRSQPPASHPEADNLPEGSDDDNAELDSLDEGLHAFHHDPFSSSSNPLDVSGGTLFPKHDGLGEFPSSSGLQQQLWQYERYNPQRKRHLRRKSSVQIQLDAMEEEQEREQDAEDERTARIEKWRLDQSKAVLEEIEKETRRRRRRIGRKSSIAGASNSVDLRASVRESIKAQRQDSVIPEEPDQQPESFWRRITRRVIRDLIGLDENTLSVIFGESLPEEASLTPTQPSPIAVAAAAEPRSQSRVSFNDSGYSWEVKLLEHIARELGVLVHQLTDHDGRAFNTYLRTQQDEAPYAGLPSTGVRDIPPRQPSLRQQRRALAVQTSPFTDSLFSPTLTSHPHHHQAPLSPSDAVDTSLWGIEEEPSDPPAAADATALDDAARKYWERDIDVQMIFTYLKDRFSSSPSPPAPGPLPASWATATTSTTASALGTSPESLRRADLIRRQHPLVSRAAAQTRRRESLLRRHQMMSTALKRPGESSSCASQSTKRSRHSRSGAGGGGGSESRHYWDLGGSGVGSAVGSGGPASAGWGEV